MPKTFECNTCGGKDQRPINSRCTRVLDSEPEEVGSVASAGQSDINLQILNELKNLSGWMSAMEKRVEKVENPVLPATSSVTPVADSPTVEKVTPDGVILSLEVLRRSDSLQARVDDRIRELQSLHPQGKFRSQRGGLNENFWCKKEVPWPQNHILSGTAKSHVTYDSLSMAQWVSGFCSIIRDESDVKLKITC